MGNSFPTQEGLPDKFGIISYGEPSMFGGHSWTKCFCMISEAKLSMYTVHRKKLIGTYDIGGSEIEVAPQKITVTGRRKPRVIFSLKSDDVAWIFFKASTEAEREAWVQSFNRALRKQTASSGKELLQRVLVGDESDGEQKGGGGGVTGVGDSEEEEEEGEYGEDAPPPVSATIALMNQQSYQIVDDSRIAQIQQALVVRVGAQLGVPRSHARALLAAHKWDSDALLLAWQADAAAALQRAALPAAAAAPGAPNDPAARAAAAAAVAAAAPAVGAADVTVAVAGEEGDTGSGGEGGAGAGDEEVLCPVCYDDVAARDTRWLTSCGHTFCRECWEGHLEAAVGAGRGCVNTSCLQHDCSHPVPRSFFEEMLTAPALARYNQFMVGTFVDQAPTMRWCPAPQCGRAISYGRGGHRDVVCECGHSFCFSCVKAPHFPATCKQAEHWRQQQGEDEQESREQVEYAKWVLKNTRPCPGCLKPIQKNRGCNHMTCQTAAGGCGHEFCWICMADWSTHGEATGGYYRCNVYDPDKTNEILSKLRSDHLAGLGSERQVWCMDRFTLQDDARRFAERERAEIQTTTAALKSKGFSDDEVSFLSSACEVVVRCRHTLKWCYCFLFFLTGEGLHKDLFQGIQGLLEQHTEQLHEMVETPLEFIKVVDPSRLHDAFRTHRAAVTRLMRSTVAALRKLRSTVQGMCDSNVVQDPDEAAAAAAAAAGEGKSGDAATAAAAAATGGGVGGGFAPWSCVLCGENNDGDASRCCACDEVRIAGGLRAQIAGIQRRGDEGEEGRTGGAVLHTWTRPGSWICDACTYENKPTHLQCGMCGSQHSGVVTTAGAGAGAGAAAARNAPPAAPQDLLDLVHAMQASEAEAAAAAGQPPPGGAPPQAPAGGAAVAADGGNEDGGWECAACTFHNAAAGATQCEMCMTQRGE